MGETEQRLLEVTDLRTHFKTDAGLAKAVDGVSFALDRGKTLALVGESGCGKSVTSLSMLGLVPVPPGIQAGGSVVFEGRDLLGASKKDLRAIRGRDIAMIFQEPMTSLNPVFRVGAQIGAALRLHRGMTKAEARARVIELFDIVGIPSPESRVDSFPHEMSGGMRQRVMIAMALACNPKLLIADEPTTALDVTIQAQILDLLRKLQAEFNMAILLITHDLGVVAEMADDVAIMYAGRIVERAPVDELFGAPKHPYTVGLFESLPRMDAKEDRLKPIQGSVPPATRYPSGCAFHPRCPHAMDYCKTDLPPLEPSGPDHEAACWLHDEDVMAKLDRPVGLPKTEEASP